jgi:hypothetical protein
VHFTYFSHPLNYYSSIKQTLTKKGQLQSQSFQQFFSKTLATATQEKLYCTCLGHLWQCDTNRNDSNFVTMPKVAKANTGDKNVCDFAK